MRISLDNAGKRFNREWIFRRATLQFNSGTAYAITGPNGSGKSTLLQVIGGMLQLSEGKIELAVGGKTLKTEEEYREISFCAPYLDLIEEMTLTEFLEFHNQFKPFLSSFTPKKIIAEIGLEAAADKQIRYYSSSSKMIAVLEKIACASFILCFMPEE